MSAAPTCDTEKKTETGRFKTPPRLRLASPYSASPKAFTGKPPVFLGRLCDAKKSYPFKSSARAARSNSRIFNFLMSLIMRNCLNYFRCTISTTRSASLIWNYDWIKVCISEANGGHIGLSTINLHSYYWRSRRGFYSFRLFVGIDKHCVNNNFSRIISVSF